MIYAQIKNGIVVNTIVADADVIAQFDGEWVAGEAATIGYRYADGVFSKSRGQLKAEREAAVAAIKVTTTAGNTFDGDEISQGRMSRAIIALSTGLAPSVTWVLADNTTIQATPAELTEALVLAGQAQAAIWVLPE